MKYSDNTFSVDKIGDWSNLPFLKVKIPLDDPAPLRVEAMKFNSEEELQVAIKEKLGTEAVIFDGAPFNKKDKQKIKRYKQKSQLFLVGFFL